MAISSVNENSKVKNPPFAQFVNDSQLNPAYQQFGANAQYPEIINQTVQDSYVANRVKASQDANPLAVAAVGSALWYGIAQGMDKVNPMFDGDYAKSIIGKAGGLGDSFSKNTFIGRKLEQFLNWFDKKTIDLSGKSQIVYTLKNHSTRPEWNFAKTPGAGLHGFLASDTDEICSKYLDNISTAQKLEQYDVAQSEIDKIAQLIKGKSKDERLLILQRKELEVLGVKLDKIIELEKKDGLQGLQKKAKEIKAKKLGFRNLAHYESLKGKFLDNPDEIVKILEKGAKNKVKISIWRGESKIKNHFIGRTCTASEYLNKYKATLGKGNDTYLGRFMAKAFGYLTEGCTNRFAGGKILVAMQAFIFADMIVNSWIAPKGEKIKTLAERFVNDFSYFIAMAVGIMGMHKVGGFKYAGLDKAGVEKYRAALKEFNENVKNGVFATKQEYKEAKANLKKLLGVQNIKNPITKLLHKFGSFLNIGNERIHPFKSNKKFNLNLLRKFANVNIIGVPMRVIIPMMVISPFLATTATKCAHAIFGKPTNSVLDEGKDVDDKQQSKQQSSDEFMALLKQEPQNVNHLNSYSSTNLLNKYKN